MKGSKITLASCKILAGGESLHSVEGVYPSNYCQAGGGGREWGEIHLIPRKLFLLRRRRRRRSNSAKTYLPFSFDVY